MNLLNRPPEVLSSEEMTRIWQAGLEIFARVPVRIQGDDEVFDALNDLGCVIEGDRVTFPEPVRDAVLERIEAHRDGRGPGRPAKVSNADLVYLASGQAIYYTDHRTDEIRPATSEDQALFSRVCDCFPGLGRSHPTLIPQDVPAPTCDLHSLALVVKNSSRPWRIAAFGARMIPYMIEVLKAAGHSHEQIAQSDWINTTCYYTSPLCIAADALEIGMTARRLLGRPLQVSSMPVIGMSAPVTISGAMAYMVAECLGANALTLAVDGRLNGWSISPVSFDMRAGTHSCSGPDTHLLRIAAAQMSAYIFGGEYTVGTAPLTSAVRPGLQSGLEKGMGAMFAIMSGARTWGALALTGTTDVGSISQLLIDLEIVGYVQHMLRGVQVDERRIGVDTIVETAPRGAYFLETPQTAEFFREELWIPELMDRRAPMAWAQDPSDMVERARTKTQQVIASAENRSPLDASQRQKIDEILADADRAVARE